MANPKFIASMYTYAWDLTDEGIDRALDRIAGAGACTEVMVAVSYHASTYFLPHNPKRPIYWGEDSALYFMPERKRYSKTKIAPRVSNVVTDADYMHRIAEAIKKRGLQFGTWIVYCFNQHLPVKYPQFARHDLFGQPHGSQLSTASPDVQEYFAAMTADVIENYKPTAVHVESLNRMPYNTGIHIAKILSPIPKRAEFVLGLDFHPAAGDYTKLRQDLQRWIRPLLERLPKPEDNEAVTEEWLRESFDGQLWTYLKERSDQTMAHWRRIAGIIHKGGAKVQSPLTNRLGAFTSDLTPAINASIDRGTIGPGKTYDDLEPAVKQNRAQLAPGGVAMVSLQPSQFFESSGLEGQIHMAASAGAGGVTLYNYGLLREEQIGFIGKALRSL